MIICFHIQQNTVCLPDGFIKPITYRCLTLYHFQGGQGTMGQWDGNVFEKDKIVLIINYILIVSNIVIRYSMLSNSPI